MIRKKSQLFYLNLYDLYLFASKAWKRKRSETDYFFFQSIQGDMIRKYLKSKGMDTSSWRILDLANGFGGETAAFDEDCENIVGLDLNFPPLINVFPQIRANAADCPFQTEYFDFILCASLIEHVPNPTILLEEIRRVLKNGGYVYLSFPPFYALNGGHDFAPFHLLGEKAAISLARYFAKVFNKRKFGRISPTPTSFKSAYNNWGLYKMTIEKANNLIVNAGFSIIDQSTKWSPINFSKIPVIGEFFTWHVQYLLRKD